MTDELDRLTSALADRYAIERELGAGGMATVYLAQDLKHERKVALKVLKPELVAVLGPDRFVQEIKTTAALQHPHILVLFDSGEVAGFLFYVMPFVEGETLRQKLDREKQLSIDEAVKVTTEVAEALDYAHGQNVIHRDIKPENILLHDGRAMVADFGIALAVGQVAGDRMTETGLSLGTPAYMSPEQATGDRELTARSDIYALGCVTYEMLAGDPPFLASNVQAMLARVIAETPVSVRTIRDTVPPHIEVAIDKAISKVAADRFDTAGAFAVALRDATSMPATPTVSPPSRAWRWPHTAAAAGGVATVAVIATVLTTGDPQASEPVGAIRPLTSYAGWEASPSWNPDGSMITYMHVAGGSADVATLSVGGGDPFILTGESPADESDPRWSPDGSKIAFASDRGAGTEIFWVPPTGGAERRLTNTFIPALERLGAWAGALGPTPWSPTGEELAFSRLHPTGEVGLWKINLSTREETRLTTPPLGGEDVEGAWSPDGERIMFTRDVTGRRSVWMVSASGGDEEPFVEDEHANMQAAWFPDGERIAFLSSRNGGGLWEMDIDTRRFRRLTTGAVGNDGSPVVAANGAIAYHNWSHEIDIYRVRPDAPTEAHERLSEFTGSQFGARVSPDGTRLLYSSNRTGQDDLWVLDLSTRQHRQVTDDPARDRLPDWAPNSEDIVFLSNRDGVVRPWVVNAETGVLRQLTDHALPWASHLAEGQGGPRWSPDGTVIGYLAPEENDALWLIAPDGTNRRVSNVRGVESFGFYQDGQRVVYTRRSPDGPGIELRTADLVTGDDVLLETGAIAEVDVAPDGTALTYIEAVSHFTMELYMVGLTEPASDGLPRLSGDPVRLTFGDGVWHVHAGSWAPDGTGVVYSRDRDFGDIYVIERQE